jgi:hypothetical protein
MTAGLDVLRPTPSQRRRYAVPVSPADTRGVPRRRSSTNKDTAVECRGSRASACLLHRIVAAGMAFPTRRSASGSAMPVLLATNRTR